MKYIRTVDGIYKSRENNYIQDNILYQIGYDFGRINLGVVILQADAIEELCDEFLVMDNGRCMEMFSNYDDLKNSGWYRSYFDIYGAIYTDKGLIYVAKLNEEGGVELI